MYRIKHKITLDITPKQRLVKHLALMIFSRVRSALHNASKVSGVMAQVSNDVCDAWRETAHPKA